MWLHELFHEARVATSFLVILTGFFVLLNVNTVTSYNRPKSLWVGVLVFSSNFCMYMSLDHILVNRYTKRLHAIVPHITPQLNHAPGHHTGPVFSPVDGEFIIEVIQKLQVYHCPVNASSCQDSQPQLLLVTATATATVPEELTGSKIKPEIVATDSQVVFNYVNDLKNNEEL